MEKTGNQCTVHLEKLHYNCTGIPPPPPQVTLANADEGWEENAGGIWKNANEMETQSFSHPYPLHGYNGTRAQFHLSFFNSKMIKEHDRWSTSRLVDWGAAIALGQRSGFRFRFILGSILDLPNIGLERDCALNFKELLPVGINNIG